MPSMGVTLILFLLVTILPSVLALMSQKVSGDKKLIWFLLSLFMSWIGFLAFYLLVVDKGEAESD